MNSQTIKNYVEIFANFGVLLGIVLLAYELNQNNALLANEARTTHMTIRSSQEADLARNSDLMQLRLKGAQGEQLTPVEELRLAYDARHVFTNWEWEFEQYRQGYLASLPVASYISGMERFPFRTRLWRSELNEIYTPAFVAFFEENVISQLATQ